ncbi:MAG: multicopper oxidase domain-containing protein, partial [Kofleriaceae bacterium]
MTITRRTLLTTGLAAGATLVARQVGAQPTPAPAPAPPHPASPGRVVVPNGSLLAWRKRDNVKIYHLRAEPIRHQIAPGLEIEAWGYNGSTPGPVIEAFEGERVRIYVTNKLPEITSVHWHGVFVPSGMDGVAGLTQAPILPGKTFRYDFTFDRAGTFM